MKSKLRGLIPHLIAALIFIASIFAYFPELLDGKGLRMDDIEQHKGMSNELADFRERTGEEAIWTNAMFGGMPGYLISVVYKGNLTRFVDKIIKIGLPRPADYMFVMMLGFYFLLISLGVKPAFSIIGALAYGFTTYNLLIIEAGHMSKVDAISYMPWVFMGVVVAFSHHRIWGAILTALFLSLQIKASHFQITYYFAFIVGFYGLYLLINAIREKQMAAFSKTLSLLVLAAGLAITANISSLYTIYDYGKDSIRGKSELTPKDGDKTSGLDKSYATQYSYAPGETFSYLIPNVYGGASNIALGENKKYIEDVDPRYKNLIAQLPQYWGEFGTTGPFYAGAIILFLFLLGLLIYHDQKKWAFLAIALLAMMLAWGKYFMPLTDFMLDHFPGYNKFRAVKMTLVMLDFVLPLLGILALYQIVKNKDEFTPKYRKRFFIAYGISAGLCMLFYLFPDSFFTLDNLGEMLEDNIRSTFTRQGADEAEIVNYLQGLSENLAVARASIIQSEALRSLGLITLAAGLIFAYTKFRFNELLLAVLVGFLIVGDLFVVNKRYVNKSDFVSIDKVKIPFSPSKADIAIYTSEVKSNPELNTKIAQHLEEGLQREDSKKRNDGNVKAKYQFRGLLANTNYRVLNLTTSTFNDAATSFFHKSVGGYSAAKLQRYQEFIEEHLSVNIQSFIQALNTGLNDSTLKANLARKYAFNMLNTKYIIISKDNAPIVNQQALGNAWFVNELAFVANPDEEIESLGSFDPAVKAVADKRFDNIVKNQSFEVDESAAIKLQSYAPNHLVYNSNNKKDGLAVFSEIYYAKGWNAYIDGQKADYIRVNYILRALPIPAGEHQIDFRFEPAIYYTTEKIAMASSGLILLLLASFGAFSLMRILKKED